MRRITAAEAHERMPDLLHEVCSSHEPIHITSDTGDAVLVGEDDWRAVQETLHLCSVPGMRESLLEGMSTPCSELDEELDW